VQQTEPAEELERRLTLPPPRSAAEHLSADLLLRLLPALHRRARALAPADPLCGRLTAILRDWPLSGVLADVAEPPVGSLAFEGHPGLQLLYAERLARNFKPAWLPTEGQARAHCELVWQELGRALPVTTAAERGDDDRR